MSHRVVPLDLDDHREALLQLWRNFESPWLEAYADRRLAWLYAENPLGPAQTWLAIETETNEVIGCASVVPSHKYIRGRLVRIGTAVDFTVLPKHRTAGAALALQRTLTQESRRAGFEYLVGKPNTKAWPVLSRIGYRRTGDCRSWGKLLHPGVESGERVDPRFSDELVSAADERFDELWNTAKAGCPIVGEKTAAYLNWRYLAFKEMNYSLYVLVDRRDQRLAGYIVYAGMEGGSFIAELFSADHFGPIVDALLLGFAARARAEGREWIALSYAGAPSFEAPLRRLGFAPRKSARPFVAYMDRECSPELRHLIVDTQHSVVFAGEMDLF